MAGSSAASRDRDGHLGHLLYVFLWVFGRSWVAPGARRAVLDPAALVGTRIWSRRWSSAGLFVGWRRRQRRASDGLPRPTRTDLAVVLAGIGLCLIAFMADLAQAAPAGLAAAYYARNTDFPMGDLSGPACSGNRRRRARAASRARLGKPS
jgi:hypothetical protein